MKPVSKQSLGLARAATGLIIIAAVAVDHLFGSGKLPRGVFLIGIMFAVIGSGLARAHRSQLLGPYDSPAASSGR